MTDWAAMQRLREQIKGARRRLEAAKACAEGLRSTAQDAQRVRVSRGCDMIARGVEQIDAAKQVLQPLEGEMHALIAQVTSEFVRAMAEDYYFRMLTVQETATRANYSYHHTRRLLGLVAR